MTKASQYKQRLDRDPSEGLKRKLSADEVMKLTNELGDWRSFTAVPEKIREYSEEPSFRAALSAFSDMDSGNKRQKEVSIIDKASNVKRLNLRSNS